MLDAFYKFASPQLKKLHSGKVRESYRLDAQHRLLVATDRLSCFDRILPRSFLGKGTVLTQMAAEWFHLTKTIVPNHFVKTVAPNITMVREAQPLPVEFIVRQYLTGSLWRAYEKGVRKISGVELPDGMKKDQKFAQAILTPTTKEKVDRPVSPAEIIEHGWVSRKNYDAIAEIALKLFAYGQSVCQSHGLSMVDTKYEFGLIDDEITLIDEIHTPDCSRFWLLDKREAANESPWFDKEYIRQYLLENKNDNLEVPDAILAEAKRRYEWVYHQLFDRSPHQSSTIPLATQTYFHLVEQKIIKPAYVAIVMGSKEDLSFAQQIRDLLLTHNIMIDMHIVSAHKNGERITELAQEYNDSIEPGCVIAVAGRSNGLGGALSANLNIPVINCPPFKDRTDIQLNVYSSLLMPSQAPAVTAVYPEQAASAALRALNLPHLRTRLTADIQNMKQKLQKDDDALRSEILL